MKNIPGSKKNQKKGGKKWSLIPLKKTLLIHNKKM